jgi:hypothetical protein
MLLRVRLFLLALSLLGSAVPLLAETPARSAPPSSTPSPTPAPPQSADAVINAMSAADLQQALQLLKSNYINPEALNETEMNRALLTGLLERLGPGVLILPERPADQPEAANTFFGEVLDGHIGYVRLGELNSANLKALDTNLQGFAGKKVDALVIDLRASTRGHDFAVAAEFAKRFVAKGKPLFTLRKSGAKQERAFTADAEPAYRGLMLVLADGDTSGAAEAVAGVLRVQNKALIIGQPTAGRAVEYSELPLNSGRILRIAVAEAVLPEGRSLFPGGLKPDLAVEMPPMDKRLVFQQAAEKGMGPFIHETERPHLNEAALIAGRNPEIDAMEAAQRARNRTGEKPPPRDLVLQRALDVVTSLSIYEQR